MEELPGKGGGCCILPVVNVVQQSLEDALGVDVWGGRECNERGWRLSSSVCLR